MKPQLDWNLFLTVLGNIDNPKSNIINIPATVLKHVNTQFCAQFSAKECTNASCGRELSRTICWKFLSDNDPSSFEHAHRLWREKCQLSIEQIVEEWIMVSKEIDRLEADYYGSCYQCSEDDSQCATRSHC